MQNVNGPSEVRLGVIWAHKAKKMHLQCGAFVVGLLVMFIVSYQREGMLHVAVYSIYVYIT